MYGSEPTYYRGLRFDSKLEVRWARVLDALDVVYVYHPRHAYRWPPAGDAKTAVHYTPDFWLPASGQFLEAKPFNPFADGDDPRWVQYAAEALRKAYAVASDPQFQGGTFGAVTLQPSAVPPITFLDPDGGLHAVDRHGRPLPDAALYRCRACGGGYVDAYPEAAPACPCCGAPVSSDGADICRPPLRLGDA
mgnify:CR=1 FL=1